MIWTVDKLEFISKAMEKGVEADRLITRKRAVELCEKYGLPLPHWLFNEKSFRGKERATYHIPEVPKPIIENIGGLKAYGRKPKAA